MPHVSGWSAWHGRAGQLWSPGWAEQRGGCCQRPSQVAGKQSRRSPGPSSCGVLGAGRQVWPTHWHLSTQEEPVTVLFPDHGVCWTRWSRVRESPVIRAQQVCPSLCFCTLKVSCDCCGVRNPCECDGNGNAGSQQFVSGLQPQCPSFTHQPSKGGFPGPGFQGPSSQEHAQGPLLDAWP